MIINTLAHILRTYICILISKCFSIVNGKSPQNSIKDVNYAQVTSKGKLSLWHFNFNTDMPQKPRIMLEDKPHFGKKKSLEKGVSSL